MRDFQINGISLMSPRWNLELIPETIPPKRGANVVIPYKDGTRWIHKCFDERTEVLNMWIAPLDHYGRIESGKAPELQVEENLEYLKALFGNMGLGLVRKKMNDGLWRTARAEIISTITFEKKITNHKVFSVELKYTDPWFYSEDLTSEIITPAATAHSWAHDNKGSAVASKFAITLTGALTNPKLENLTTGVWLQINQEITTGMTIAIDTEEFTVTSDGTNMIHTIFHSGSPDWFLLAPGTNNLKLTCDATPSGAVKVEYYPSFF